MNAARSIKLILVFLGLLLFFLPPALSLAQDTPFLSIGSMPGGAGNSFGAEYSLIGSFPAMASNRQPSGGDFNIFDGVQTLASYDHVFVNSNWTNTASGEDLGENRRYLSNAFVDIQTALQKVEPHGQIYVSPGTYSAFYLNRPVTVNIQANTTIQGDLDLSDGSLQAPDGLLQLSGSLTLHGGSFQVNQGTFKFSGQGESRLTLAGPVQFTNLVIGPGVTLIESNPANLATYSQELTNSGIIRKALPLQGAGEYRFGLTGASITIQPPGKTAQLQIEQAGQKHAQAGKLRAGSAALPLVYRLMPEGGEQKAALCLRYTQTQFSSASIKDERSLQLCAWDSSQWNCFPQGANSDPANRVVCADDVPLSGDWIIAAQVGSVQNAYFLPVISSNP